MTNFEKLKAMSEKKRRKVLSTRYKLNKYGTACGYCTFHNNGCPTKGSCDEGFFNWLNQEAEDE